LLLIFQSDNLTITDCTPDSSLSREFLYAFGLPLSKCTFYLPWRERTFTKVDQNKAYWRENLRYLFILLAIWFFVSYGCGILLADQLNEIKIGGFPLGFWFAQQGAIYVFVILIFVYVYLMNKLDKKYNVDED